MKNSGLSPTEITRSTRLRSNCNTALLYDAVELESFGVTNVEATSMPALLSIGSTVTLTKRFDSGVFGHNKPILLEGFRKPRRIIAERRPTYIRSDRGSPASMTYWPRTWYALTPAASSR